MSLSNIHKTPPSINQIEQAPEQACEPHAGTQAHALKKDKQSKINDLLNSSTLWRASHSLSAQYNEQEGKQPGNSVSTGFRQIDQQLACGGWPLGQFIECLSPGQPPGQFPGQPPDRPSSIQRTQGSLYLFLPAIQQLNKAFHKDSPPVVLIAPPFTPYLPGWLLPAHNSVWMIHTNNINELLWATEQTLRSNCATVVISWLNNVSLRMTQLRKLQLAARCSQSLFIGIRDLCHKDQPSPAALRLTLSPRKNKAATQLEVGILKQSGQWGGQRVSINWHSRLQQEAMPVAQWPVHHPMQETFQHQTGIGDRLDSTHISASKWS